MSLCWGIAGISEISHEFAAALKLQSDSSEHDIKAIVNNSLESAQIFATKYDIKNAYDNYEFLAQNVEVEVVYIAVLNPEHYAVAKLMIEHGKHVVCERPFAMNYAQAKQLIDLAQQQRVFIMEGLWPRFSTVYKELKKLLELQSFGDIKEIYIKHGFVGLHNEQISKKSLGGGTVLHLGCYALQLLLFMFGNEEPKSVKAKGKINFDGVDLFFDAELQFADGKKAYIICSALQQLDNQATVITTKGPICIPNYWCPTKYYALGRFNEYKCDKAHFGFNAIANDLKSCIRSGKLECEMIPLHDTLLIAKLQDEIRKQIGVHYECDKMQRFFVS